MGRPSFLEIIGASIFFLAVIHTFLVGRIEHYADRLKKGSLKAVIFHLLAEVEVVFGLWALLFVLILWMQVGSSGAIEFFSKINYNESAFVFVVMCLSSARPVLFVAQKIIFIFSKLLPIGEKRAFYISALVIGPLLGSFITEPAAMTLTALILLENFYRHQMSLKFKYATLGLLFVNISVGGTLTHFAAPPVLMVASKWNWDMSFMFSHFGYKSAIAVLTSTLFYSFLFKKELNGFLIEKANSHQDKNENPPWWLSFIHILFLALVVITGHHPKIFIFIFCFYLGFLMITDSYQEKLKMKGAFMVAFFLGGLVTLGEMQTWWLKQLMGSMSDLALFLGATGLTAVTDNAALTYLGSLVELTESSKHALLGGAVAGGGLTVIANAPNPVGFGILREAFGADGIEPLKLFLWALIPTFFGILALLLLPSLF